MAKSRKPSEPEAESFSGTGRENLEQVAPPPESPEPSRSRIAERAYELYLARGGSHGQDWDDWLAAEQELSNGRPPRDE